MAGQQQIKTLNQSSLYEKFSSEVLKQADLYYTDKKFKMGGGMNQLKAFHAYLLKDVLCEDNCVIVDFINSKLSGELEKNNN